jgi:hypothetical protein
MDVYVYAYTDKGRRQFCQVFNFATLPQIGAHVEAWDRTDLIIRGQVKGIKHAANVGQTPSLPAIYLVDVEWTDRAYTEPVPHK